jgi:hypothetical protein
MFSFFRQSFRQWARSGTKSAGAQKAPARRLQCETLEDRILPSMTGTEMLVNTTKTYPEQQPAAATSSNGMSVVVWTEVFPGYTRNILAQRFDAYGHKLGGQIVVAGGRSPQHKPSVAIDAQGNFVVTWITDYSTSDQDIHAAIFRANGTRVGNEIVVASTPKNEYDPSVAMAANGKFVISYTYQFNTSDTDIKAILFNANGSIARTIDVAVSTRVEKNSRVTMSPDGRFAIAYTKSDDIYVQRYDRYGNHVGTNAVAGGPDLQEMPDITMDSHGNSIVVWQEQVRGNWNIYARAISSTGQLGSTKTVAASSAQETLPIVAVDSLNGKYVVAYQYVSGTTHAVKVTEMSASGSQIETLTMDIGMSNPFVSLGGPAHRYLVTGQSIGAKAGDFDGGVFARFGIL